MAHPRRTSVNTACDTLFPSPSDLANIEICQSEARTAYCWPPNGTRICARTPDVFFYWPPGFYQADSGIYITHDAYVDSDFSYENSGKLTLKLLDIDRQAYSTAKSIPGRVGEKSLNITIRESRPYSDDIWHQGPILVLVDLDEIASATASAGATALPSATDADLDHGAPKLAAGAIAGIAFGAIIGAVLLGMLCYSYCRSRRGAQTAGGRRSRQLLDEASDAEKAGAETAGAETTVAEAGAGRVAGGPAEIGVVDGQRIEPQRREIVRAHTSEPPAYEPPPPNYAP